MTHAVTSDGNELYLDADGNVWEYSPTRGYYWILESEYSGMRDAPAGLRRVALEN